MKADLDPEYFYTLIALLFGFIALIFITIVNLASYPFLWATTVKIWAEKKQKEAEADVAKARREMDDGI